MMPVSPTLDRLQRERPADDDVGKGGGVFVAGLAIDEHRPHLFHHAVEVEDVARVGAEHGRGAPAEVFFRHGLRRQLLPSAGVQQNGFRRVEGHAAAFRFQHELGPDDERETEQQHRLAVMVGEEAGDADAVFHQIAGGGAIQGEDGLGREIAHAPDRRARAVRLSPSVSESAASSTRNGRRWLPRCSLRIDTSARDWRNAVVLSIMIRLGCWPVVEEECNSRTTFSGGTALEQEVLEHRNRQRGDVGRRAPSVRVSAEPVEKPAVGRAAVGHLAAELAQDGRQQGVLFGLRGGVLRAADQGLDLFVNHAMLPLAVSPTRPDGRGAR